MKKFGVLAILLIISGVLYFAPAFAQSDEQAGVLEMARYYPDDALFFAALRTDDGFIEQLDTVIEAVTTPLAPLGVPPINLSMAIALLSQTTLDISWLGDYVAVGVTDLVDDQAYYVTIDIDDPAAAADAFRAAADQLDLTETPSNSYVQFTTQTDLRILITETELYLTEDSRDPYLVNAERDTDLRDNESFTTAINALPESAYNVLLYGEALLTQTTSGLYDSGIEFYPSAIGATILDDNTLVIDAVTLTEFEAGSAVDPDFARFIPANASAAVQATNFTSFYDNTIITTYDTLQQASFAQDGNLPSIDEQIQATFQMLGIDLRNDVLSWTTGDYALFMRADTVEIARGVITNKMNINNLIDFGVVFEATDPDQASAFAARLTELITGGLAAQDEEFAQVEQITIGDLEVTLLSLDIPASNDGANIEDIQFEIVIGSNDDIFFVGTRGALEPVLTGSDSLIDQPFYQAAQSYLLPNPTSVWVTNGDGFLIGLSANPVGGVVYLALLGPAIGNVFSNIVSGLQGGTVPTATPTPTPSPTPDAAEVDAQLQPLRDINALVNHSTMSATITDEGYTQFRMSVTLNLP